MIRPATVEDLGTICDLIRALAEYERLSREVVLDEDQLREHLFGSRRFAEVLLAEEASEVVRTKHARRRMGGYSVSTTATQLNAGTLRRSGPLVEHAHRRPNDPSLRLKKLKPIG
jgi:hypothetical protein